MGLPPAFQHEGRGLGVLAALARGGLLVDLAQVVLEDVGVHLSGADIGVAEHLLDVADTRPAAEHFGRASVAEAVGGNEVIGDVCGCGRGFDDAVQVLGLHSVAVHAQEEAIPVFVAAVVFEVVRPDLLDVARAPVERGGADRDETVLSSFALHDADTAFLVVEVVDGELA